MDVALAVRTTPLETDASGPPGFFFLLGFGFTSSGPRSGISQVQTNLGVGTDFRLVLMWPTWPQLAHLRAVPSLLRPFPGLEAFGAGAGVGPAASEMLGDDGPGPGDAAAAGLPTAEALAMLRALRRSRCRRRSWLRSRRASSSRSFCWARASSSLSPVGMRVL